ncbi:MAG: DUF2798 domain-containing protein [Proteobacteria bacterium]|nr:DUF2798 domain-containing protein [Pseudomonadota bacterium]
MSFISFFNSLGWPNFFRRKFLSFVLAFCIAKYSGNVILPSLKS